MDSSSVSKSSRTAAVIDFAKEKAARIRARREGIVHILNNPGIPGGQVINEDTRTVEFDEESLAYFRKGLALFGVTELDPANPDSFERLMATWSTLLSVGSELLARDTFGEGVHNTLSSIWHPAYKQYVEALWEGDDAAVKAGARALNIHVGVAESTAMLWQGPV